MNASRRMFLASIAGGLAAGSCSSSSTSRESGVARYVRYEHDGAVSFGALEGETVDPLRGDLFGSRERSGESVPLSAVKILYPIEPSKILALAGNYRSHIGGAEPSPYPQVFYKTITSLQHPEEPIVFPAGAQDLHYEAELVIVIGKKAKNVTQESAADYILGYTCGNDVSERNWQNGSIDGPENKDLQWWRAKGSDTFSPLGPAVAVGLDYAQSAIQSRLNGEVKQQQLLSDLIASPPEIVSFISRYVTLLPGDLIFTGTPGETSAMKPGDVIEIEIDGIGVLRNQVGT